MTAYRGFSEEPQHDVHPLKKSQNNKLHTPEKQYILLVDYSPFDKQIRWICTLKFWTIYLTSRIHELLIDYITSLLAKNQILNKHY